MQCKSLFSLPFSSLPESILNRHQYVKKDLSNIQTYIAFVVQNDYDMNKETKQQIEMMDGS